MAVTTLLLILASLCQILLVSICIRGLGELARRQKIGGEGVAPSLSRTAIGLPATIAVVLQAAFLNAALLVLSFPSFMAGEIPRGLLFLSGTDFAGFAVSAVVTMAVTQSRSKGLVAELVVSVVGLICLFAAHYLALKA
jgi:hypothetical protein